MSESIKTQIIQGTARTGTLYVEELELEVTLRPLSDAESDQAQAAALRGQQHHLDPTKGRVPTSMDIDVAESASGQAEARRIKAAYGLSVGNEKWTPKEVGKYMSSAAVRKIAAKVDELSGGDDLANTAREFRGDDGGSDDREAASAGDAAGGDAG